MQKKDAKYYQIGKSEKFANERYKFMSELNISNNIEHYGQSKHGTHYYHLIEYDENNSYNLLNEPKILAEVNQRFQTKAGDKKRVLTNLLSSQACCFNLFSPLKEFQNQSLTNKLFSKLLKKEVEIERIEIEYTPNQEESIGDQSKIGGTDADLAVFYKFGAKQKGIILVEFKYIENKFSCCSSYTKKAKIRTVCNSNNFLVVHNKQAELNKKFDCGYMKYENWDLTKNSQVFDYRKVLESPKCPFRFSLNQLWRNLLLVEKVAKMNKFDEFHFWILCPEENLSLWSNHSEDVLKDFKSILTEEGENSIRKLDIEKDFVSFIEENSDNDWTKQWINKFREKYIKK